MPRRQQEPARRIFRTRRRRARILPAAVVAAVTVGVVAFAALGGAENGGRPSAGTSATAMHRIAVGRGVRGATVVVRGPVSRRRPVVVFLHGWGLLGRRSYRAWVDHLARGGNAVIVPRYQRDVNEPPGRVLDNALAGIRAALRRVPVDRSSLVVAGHSAGAALAADYAAVAAGDGLPSPRAVFAVYPGRALRRSPTGIPAQDASQIAPSTRLLVLAGARDDIVGEEPARELMDSATAVPAERRRLIVIDDPAVATHFAPVFGGRRVRELVWRRLDRLIASVRP
jgi:acetyl esterase/lipase